MLRLKRLNLGAGDVAFLVLCPWGKFPFLYGNDCLTFLESVTLCESKFFVGSTVCAQWFIILIPCVAFPFQQLGRLTSYVNAEVVVCNLVAARRLDEIDRTTIQRLLPHMRKHLLFVIGIRFFVAVGLITSSLSKNSGMCFVSLTIALLK